MSNFLNSGLNKVAISKEDKTQFGVPSKDFVTGDTAFYFEQDLDNPVNPVDTINKVVKKSTRAKQIQSKKDMIGGRNDVTVNFSNNVSKNDFMTLFAPMFFQHSYKYTPTVTDGSLVDVSSVGDVVTIEVTNIGTLINGDYVFISGRTDFDEDGTYEVSNVTANSFDIEYENGFATETVGTVTAEMNTHESVYEDNTSCNKHELDSSFTFYMPYGWDKTDCSEGKGDYVTGLVPKTGNIDFVASTYTIDMIGKSLVEDTQNLPIESEYIEPISTGGFFNIDSPIIKDADGVVQDCSTLSINFERTVTEDLRTFRGGKLSRAVVDGGMITGSYTLLFASEDEIENHSKRLYDNRKSLDNSEVYSVGLEASDGSSIEITGEFVFMNEVKNKIVGGWEFSTDFEILYGDNADNISCKVVNGISESIAELFNTEA